MINYYNKYIKYKYKYLNGGTSSLELTLTSAPTTNLSIALGWCINYGKLKFDNLNIKDYIILKYNYKLDKFKYYYDIFDIYNISSNQAPVGLPSLTLPPLLPSQEITPRIPPLQVSTKPVIDNPRQVSTKPVIDKPGILEHDSTQQDNIKNKNM